MQERQKDRWVRWELRVTVAQVGTCGADFLPLTAKMSSRSSFACVREAKMLNQTARPFRSQVHPKAAGTSNAARNAQHEREPSG